MSEKFSKKPMFKKTKINKNSLIAEREKTKLYHKYKKMLRKEKDGNANSSKSIMDEIAREQSNENEKHLSGNKSKLAPASTSTKQSSSGKFKSGGKPFKTAYMKAQEEYERNLAEKQKKIEESQKRKQEQEESLKRYKRAKKENYRTICKKTRYGQLKMGDQINKLLTKIEKSKNELK